MHKNTSVVITMNNQAPAIGVRPKYNLLDNKKGDEQNADKMCIASTDDFFVYLRWSDN